jgi:hypothetical protein
LAGGAVLESRVDVLCVAPFGFQGWGLSLYFVFYSN